MDVLKLLNTRGDSPLTFEDRVVYSRLIRLGKPASVYKLAKLSGLHRETVARSVRCLLGYELAEKTDCGRLRAKEPAGFRREWFVWWKGDDKPGRWWTTLAYIRVQPGATSLGIKADTLRGLMESLGRAARKKNRTPKGSYRIFAGKLGISTATIQSYLWVGKGNDRTANPGFGLVAKCNEGQLTWEAPEGSNEPQKEQRTIDDFEGVEKVIKPRPIEAVQEVKVDRLNPANYFAMLQTEFPSARLGQRQKPCGCAEKKWEHTAVGDQNTLLQWKLSKLYPAADVYCKVRYRRYICKPCRVWQEYEADEIQVTHRQTQQLQIFENELKLEDRSHEYQPKQQQKQHTEEPEDDTFLDALRRM